MRNSPAMLAAATMCAAVTSIGCQPSVSPPDSKGSVSVASFDEFNKDLAKRVTAVLVPGGASDFQVVVTPAMDPIGTLYRAGRSVPFDDRTCAPPAEPTARNMPNVFPAYQLDAKVAAEFGLDESVLQGVSASGRIATGSSFSFSIVNPQLKVLSDTAVRAVLGQSACAAATKGEMVIVRGYVTGQRRFSTKGDRGGTAKAGIAKVGKFDVDASNAGFVSITDEAPQAFLQILSAVITSPTHPGDPADPGVASVLTAPQAIGGQGKIYVQQDRADDPQKGKQLVDVFSSAGLNVAGRVEQTASKQTPDQAQVRYFADGDKEKATAVLDTVKQQYPGAVLVPLKIHAPPGQLEVWLPRVKPKP